jgi:hypothetical protein
MSPPGRGLFSGVLDNGHWTTVATHVDADVVRVEPFADIELELNALWED